MDWFAFQLLQSHPITALLASALEQRLIKSACNRSASKSEYSLALNEQPGFNNQGLKVRSHYKLQQKSY